MDSTLVANLVPRVLRLLGQRVVAGRDLVVMKEKCFFYYYYYFLMAVHFRSLEQN